MKLNGPVRFSLSRRAAGELDSDLARIDDKPTGEPAGVLQSLGLMALRTGHGNPLLS